MLLCVESVTNSRLPDQADWQSSTINLSQKASTYMAPKRRPAHVVITLHDSQFDTNGVLPPASLVEVGGTIQWRCDTPEYPIFDIVFPPGKKNPIDGSTRGWTKTGDINNPVVAKVTIHGDFEYEVNHHHKSGVGTVNRGNQFIVCHICLGCR